jgi:hypothetical protein
MHADKDRVALSVRPQNPVVEFNKFIVVPHQHGVKGACQFGLEALHHVESQILFLFSGPSAGGAAVFSAVTGIEDHCCKTSRSGSMAPVVMPRRRRTRGAGTGIEQNQRGGDGE